MTCFQKYRNRGWRELKFGAIVDVGFYRILDRDAERIFRGHVGLTVCFLVWRLQLNWFWR